MRNWLNLIIILIIMSLFGCRTMDGRGSAAGAGTYPLKATPAAEDTVLLTVVDGTKAGGFDIRRTPIANMPVSTPVSTALGLKQDTATAVTTQDVQGIVDAAVSGIPGSTVVADEIDPTKAAAAVVADSAGTATTADSATYATTAGTAGTVAAVSGDAITSGTVPDARIASTIARDSEVAAAVSGKMDTPTGTTSQVVLGDGSLGSLPAGSTITPDGTDPSKAAVAVLADSATSAGSVIPVKTPGVAGMMAVHEAEGTSTLKTGFIGPDNSSVNYVYKFPNTVPVTGETLVAGTVSAEQTLPDGSTGTIINLTHAAGGGGATINDLTTSTTEVWSSDKTSSEIAAASGASGLVSTPPAYRDTAGMKGQYAYSANGLIRYDCVDTNTWFTSTLTDSLSNEPVYPEIVDAIIAASGSEISLTFDVDVERGIGFLATDFNLDTSGSGNNIALTYVSGDNTPTLVFSIATPIQLGELVNVDFAGTANSIENATTGDDLAAIVDFSVTNNSVVTSNYPTSLTWAGLDNTSTPTIVCSDPLYNGIAINGLEPQTPLATSVIHTATGFDCNINRAYYRFLTIPTTESSDFTFGANFQVTAALNLTNWNLLFSAVFYDDEINAGGFSLFWNNGTHYLLDQNGVPSSEVVNFQDGVARDVRVVKTAGSFSAQVYETGSWVTKGTWNTVGETPYNNVSIDASIPGSPNYWRGVIGDFEYTSPSADTTDPDLVAGADSTHDGVNVVNGSVTLTEANPASPAVTFTATNCTPASGNCTGTYPNFVTPDLTPTGTGDIVITYAAVDTSSNAATGTDLVQQFTYSAGGITVNDTFDGTENPLATNWTSVGYANWGGFQKSGGSAYGIAAEWNGSYWDTDQLANNQYGKITLTGSPSYHGVMVRQNANGCYVAYASSHGDRLYVNRYDVSGAVWTNLVSGASYITTTVPSGATIELRFSGSTPTVLVNGTPVGTLINDSTYASGNAGVISYGTAVGIDSFEAGDL